MGRPDNGNAAVTIFISVASYCDPLMPFTVMDAFAKARRPDKLVFGIADQHPDSRIHILESSIPRNQLRYVRVHPVESRGVCWARSLVESMYMGEEYVLQVDSHTLFEQDWDVALRGENELLEECGYRPILSTYPYSFEFTDEGEIVLSEYVATSKGRVLVMRPKEDQKLTEDSAVLEFQAEFISSEIPLPGSHIGAGFLFARGRLFEEVPYDPQLYFHGEEQNIAIRAWTRGWDIFHPTYIPLYHMYKTPDSSYITHHWHSEWDNQRAVKFPEMTDAAAKRLTDLLYRRKDLGVYGLGKVRSLEDYAWFSGIDYINKTIQREFREPGNYE